MHRKYSVPHEHMFEFSVYTISVYLANKQASYGTLQATATLACPKAPSGSSHGALLKKQFVLYTLG